MNLSKMTKAELLEQAAVLELEIPGAATNAEIIAAINAELGDEAAEAEASAASEGFCEIMFANDQKNKQPVFIGVNGKSFRFPRGKWVKCPKYLLPTIELAKKEIKDDEEGTWMSVDAYPYQVKGQ